MSWDWSRPLKIEHEIQRVISKQAHYGVYFNKQQAEDLVKELTYVMEEIEHEILPLFTYDVEIPYGASINKPFLKSGDYSRSVKEWYSDNKERSTVGGPFTRVRFVKLDLGKRQRVANQLLKLGWKPTFFTDKGTPQIVRQGSVCPEIRSISGRIGRYLPLWYIYSHRRGQVKGWLGKLRSDSRLSAGAIVNGTNTGRMTHRVVVNVPKAAEYVLYGNELRELFTVPKGKTLLGVDAAGLELRMLCHYMNDEEYTKKLLHEDIHTFNQGLAGLPTRDDAKTFIYAFLYGAGNTKLGSIVGGSSRKGSVLRKQFLTNLPSLGELSDKVVKASKKGYLKGIDGRKVRMRRDPETREVMTHKALNTLLQSSGSIVMKVAAILFNKMIEESRIDANIVINMHDEYQVETWDEQVGVVSKMMERSIVLAGEVFDLRIPLEGECKVGLTWADTH